MSQQFIIYKPYKDLSTIECLLMSWIISLNDAKQTICFSNEYASKTLKVSDRTISSSVSKLKLLGYINTFQTRERRVIYLIKHPELENISLEVCDLIGEENISTQVEDTSIQGGNNFHTEWKELPSRVENTSTNNIEYKKEYTKEVSMLVEPYPTNFIKLVELYQEEGTNTERAFSSWNKLNPLQQKMALDNVGKYLLYLQKVSKNKKELHFYLSDEAFTWNAVKNFKEQKKVITDKEKQDKLKNQLNIQ